MRSSIVRIYAPFWADILVGYALFVMQNYLTDVWKLSVTHAAAILNFWGGFYMILPAFFLFLVDQFLSNTTMLVFSNIAYSVGIGFVTMSTPPVLANSTGTCKEYEPECIGHTQKALFYTGMVLIAIGMAGHHVSLRPLIEEQQKKPGAMTCGRFFGIIIMVLIPVVGAIALPYIKPWTLHFGIPAICTTIATLLFLTLWDYNEEPPQGSPLTGVFRVYIASFLNRSRQFPMGEDKYYRVDEATFRTPSLRCLDKAAIMEEDDELNKGWRLCSLAEVEDAKVTIRMVPMWMTFVICGIVSSIGNTYFVEQSNNMNRKIGSWVVPSQVLLLAFTKAKEMFGSWAEGLVTKKKKWAPSTGIAVAMIFSILCCVTAAGVEIRRLKVIRRHDLLDKPDDDIPMSVFWLLFQFVLLAGLDSFLEKSVVEFYKDQSPESMTEYLDYFAKGVSGLGYMCSVLSVYVVGKISEKGGRTNWFQDTLNRSRLDRYYWVLAVLSGVNLIVFVFVAWRYRYKTNTGARDNEETGREGPEMPETGEEK